LAFLPTIWKFTQSARKYTITIIRLLSGLLPLLPARETTDTTTETKHVKEIVDAEARRGASGFGLPHFLCSFFSENTGEKERICYYMAVFVDDLIICFLYVLPCLCLLSFIFFL